MHNNFIFLIALLFFTVNCTTNTENNTPASLDAKTLALIQQAKYLEEIFVKADSTVLNFPDEHTIAGLHYIHVSEDSNIFVIDQNFARTVLQFDKKGEFIRRIGEEGEGPGEYRRPLHLSTNRNYVVISDGNLSRISFFHRDGSFSHSFQVKLMIWVASDV